MDNELLVQEQREELRNLRKQNEDLDSDLRSECDMLLQEFAHCYPTMNKVDVLELSPAVLRRWVSQHIQKTRQQK